MPGEREWGAIPQQDRCCDAEPSARCHWPSGREGAQGDEAKSENLPADRVLLSSVSKKDMFRFRREAAAKYVLRDVSAKNLIYPVFYVRSHCVAGQIPRHAALWCANADRPVGQGALFDRFFLKPGVSKAVGLVIAARAARRRSRVRIQLL